MTTTVATPTHEVVLGHLGVFVFDEVLPDPAAYTAVVRALPFRTVHVGGGAFHGIAASPDRRLERWMVATFPQATPTLGMCRRSPLGQGEPNYIHTDTDMGDWTAILYLTETPPPEDGTIFWRDRLTGVLASTAITEAEYAAWRQPDRWEEWARVQAQPNRVVVFRAPLYHSRAILENYGEGSTARLIQVLFGIGSLTRS